MSKKKSKSLVLCLLYFLLAVPFSHALEQGQDENVSLNNLLNYSGLQESDSENSRAGMKYFAKYNDIENSKIDLKKERAELRTGYMDWSENSAESYTPQQNAQRPLVYDVSAVTFSDEKGTEGFDLEFLSSTNGVVQMGAAFLTNLFLHEFGHEVVANYVGATGTRLEFFKREDEQFFLGTSTVETIDDNSMLPYAMGGEFFADIAFEHALQSYRKKPSTFNKSLMLASGSDFLWYCVYAYYLSDGHQNFDPVHVREETGLSENTIFSIIAAKTVINAYRAYSGEDIIIPYFSVDKYSASLNIIIPFEVDKYIGLLAGNKKQIDLE